MYGVNTYYKVLNAALIGVLVSGLCVRVLTNIFYGQYYIENPATESDMLINKFWANVYFKGQAFFELVVVFFSAVMTRRNFSKYVQVVINFFFGLCLFSWVKDFLLDPLKWQTGEYAGFWFGLMLTMAELVVVKMKITLNKITHYLKLVFK